MRKKLFENVGGNQFKLIKENSNDADAYYNQQRNHVNNWMRKTPDHNRELRSRFDRLYYDKLSQVYGGWYSDTEMDEILKLYYDFLDLAVPNGIYTDEELAKLETNIGDSAKRKQKSVKFPKNYKPRN